MCLFPLPFAVGFIPDFDDAVHLAVGTDFVHLLDEVRLVYLERQFIDDDMGLAAPGILGPHPAPDDDLAASGLICLPDLVLALDDASCREIRPFDD